MLTIIDPAINLKQNPPSPLEYPPIRSNAGLVNYFDRPNPTQPKPHNQPVGAWPRARPPLTN
jgi:hypothetical protein